MKYKLVASDLDGTLLDSNSNISEINLDAIDKISKKGVDFVVVTGRTYYEIPSKIRDCKNIKYIVYSDGSVVLEKENNHKIFSGYIDTQTVLDIYDEVSNCDAMFEVYENKNPVCDKTKINHKSYDHFGIEKGYYTTMDSTRIGVDDLREYLKSHKRVELINIFFADSDERKRCFNSFKKYSSVSFTTSMDNNIELMSSCVSKGNAVRILVDELKIKTDEVICIGDSANDLTMLSSSGLALTPNNASDKIKSVADTVICSNDDGIAKYVYDNFIK